MTCVAGLIAKKKLWIGADSAGTVSDGSQILVADGKVFQVGDMVIGCAGSFRMAQLLRYSLELPERDQGQPIAEYMAREVANAIRKCLIRGGHINRMAEQQEMEGACLLGYEGRLFRLQSDLSVLESISGFDAVGSGADLAIGVLHYTHDKRVLPRKRIEGALKASAFANSAVRPPFTIASLG